MNGSLVPKVCIGSFGRFHTFDLAREMVRHGHLSRLYTAYPKWKIDSTLLQNVDTFPWICVPMMAAEKAGLYTIKGKIVPLAIQTFGRWMARRLVVCNVFHCIASFGLESYRIARNKYGALIVCDRGVSHILFQEEILSEEFGKWDVPFQAFDRRIVDREIQEYEECDLIFVPSTFAYRSFVEKGIPADKLRTIPLGIDLELFHPVPKKDNVFRVMYVGTLSLQKGIPYLLEAVSSVRIPDLEVWLLGGIKQEVKPLLGRYEGRYKYLGHLPRTELYKYYSQASVLVMPSVQDGFGLVQAQAMACGVPVIATTNTGAEDLFTDGKEGFIIPIRDASQIQEKLVYLYENPEVRDEMGRAALKRVQDLGGWRTYGDKVVACYEDALHHRKSPSAGESHVT